MAEGTPVTYEDLTRSSRRSMTRSKFLEADLIGSFQRTRSHGIRWKGFSPEGALDGVDLSTPSEERQVSATCRDSPRRDTTPVPTTLPFALAAPEVPSSPAFVVYKIGGDPSDYQFLYEAPKEIPHGYTCTYVPDYVRALTNQTATAGTWNSGSSLDQILRSETWLAKYATPTNLRARLLQLARIERSETWLAKYATPTNLKAQLLQLAQSLRSKRGWLSTPLSES
ncbi:hypothetical protein QYE76_005596 [Lolium multiflorum]|uniref:Uncharacterized protein n=1 Tax=Lolium multiflorum TaxID=4521 RepID=A0AAD8RT01_LOLMU|nr:hypothetical protein QYE76_005596 [Lolium multiflorum]